MRNPTFGDPFLSIVLVGLLGFLLFVLYATDMLPRRLRNFLSRDHASALLQPAVNAPEASAPQTPDQSRVDGDLANGVVSLPDPQYPDAARSQGIADTIYVAVTVNGRGRVIAARALNGPPPLQRSAEAAARQARFTEGRSRRRSGTIKYDFKQ